MLAENISYMAGEVRVYCIDRVMRCMSRNRYRVQVDLEELRREELLEWLSIREGNVYSMRYLNRVGFFDEIFTDNQHEAHDWGICRIT